jgi:hypothetical protein
MREQNYGPAATSTSPRAPDLPPLWKAAADEEKYSLAVTVGKVAAALSGPDVLPRWSGKRKYYVADCPFCEERCVGPGYLCEDLPPTLRGHFIVEPLRSRKLFYACWTCGCLGVVGGKA